MGEDRILETCGIGAVATSKWKEMAYLCGVA